MPRTILLIDDDPAVLYTNGRCFQTQGWEVYRAMNGEEGLQLYDTHHADVVLLDLRMPGIDGMEVLERLATKGATVVVLTGHGDVDTAVRAIQMGAENFITKPATPSHLLAIVERAVEKVELRRTNQLLASQIQGASGRMGIGRSGKMQALERQVDLLAASSQTTVLLLGESGTGKGWVAQALHARSSRARGPFVEVNCAGLSATFLDSELFGHEKGAFTDAKSMKRGLFEVANGGTLFLDEIGDLAPELQPKLLKVLESKSFRRLGGTTEIKTDVRLIAATNKNLADKVGGGSFREDLFYRLSVVRIQLPPLRERTTEDILELINRMLQTLAGRHPGATGHLSGGALGMLVRYEWPGNVRQLQNVLEHALIMSEGAEEILPEHLPPELHIQDTKVGPPQQGFVARTLREVEQRHIEHTLIACGGNRTQAAAVLGISRATLHSRLREYRSRTEALIA